MAHTTLASTDRALEKIGDFVAVQDYQFAEGGRSEAFAQKAAVSSVPAEHPEALRQKGQKSDYRGEFASRRGLEQRRLVLVASATSVASEERRRQKSTTDAPEGAARRNRAHGSPRVRRSRGTDFDRQTGRSCSSFARGPVFGPR